MMAGARFVLAWWLIIALGVSLLLTPLAPLVRAACVVAVLVFAIVFWAAVGPFLFATARIEGRPR